MIILATNPRPVLNIDPESPACPGLSEVAVSPLRLSIFVPGKDPTIVPLSKLSINKTNKLNI